MVELDRTTLTSCSDTTHSVAISYDTAGNLTGDPTVGTLVCNGAGQVTAQSGLLNRTYTYAGADQTELTDQRVCSGSG